MKASKSLAYIALAVVGLAAGSVLAWNLSEDWRQERGFVFATSGDKSNGLRGDLKKLDEKLAPANEKRIRLREELKKFQAKEREVVAEVAAALSKLEASDRANVEEDFRRDKLSDENVKRPEIAVAFARYGEALTLRRETNALRERLAKYELEIAKALAERERISRRISLLDALGYDPENANEADALAGFETLDELTALTEGTAENADRALAELTPDDVVGATAENDSEARESLLRDLANVDAGKNNPDDVWNDEEIDDSELAKKLDKLAEETFAEKTWWRKAIASIRPQTYFGMALVGFGFAVVSILVLGAVGLWFAFAAPKKSNPQYNGSQFPPNQYPQPSQPPCQYNQQQPAQSKELSPEKVLFIILALVIGAVCAGPIGVVFGGIVALGVASFRLLMRVLGVVGFVLLGLAVAFIAFIALIVAMFI